MGIKKVAVLCLMCAMLLQSGAYALEISNVNENPITITGKTDSGILVAASVKDEDNTYYYFDEIKSDEEGNYAITFKMPDDVINKTVEVEFKPQGKAEEAVYFEFSGSEIREEALNTCLEAIDEKNAGDFLVAFEKVEYKTALEMMGIPVDELLGNATVKKEAVDKICESGTEAESFVSDFNKLCFVSSIKNNYKEGKKAFFEGSDFEADGVKYSEETDSDKKSWVEEKMLDDENISSVATAEKAYKKMCVYYLVNNAKYTDLPELIEKYKDELGVSGTSAYQQFSAMTTKNKNKVAEAIVQESGFGNLIDDFIDYLKEGVESVKVSSNSSSGGNGGGGSSSGGSSVMTGIVAPEKVTGEHPDENETPEPEEKKIFDDVAVDAWYYQAVKSLNAMGIVAGKTDSSYLPNDNVKREEFLAMLIRALGKQDYETSVSVTFGDVEAGAWYENIVKTAVELELTSGYSDEQFGVGDLITRQDAAVFATRAAKLMGIELTHDVGELFADDSDISDYAKESVYSMRNASIISGIGNNNYLPKANCTRAQAAVIVYKLLEGGNN